MLEDRFAQHDKIPGDTYVDPSADYQMRTWDYQVRPSADAQSGAITITLPPVAEAKGRFYSIAARDADPTNTITIVDKDDSESWGGDYIFVYGGNSVIFYSDGLKWTAIFGGIGVLSTKVVLTAQQIKALHATPITLVPALGATKLVEFLSATLLLTYGSEVLAEVDDNLAVKYTDGSGVAVSDTIEMTGFIDQSADTVTRGVPIKDAIVAASASVGEALVLDNPNDEFTGNASNDSTLTVWTLFRVIETG